MAFPGGKECHVFKASECPCKAVPALTYSAISYALLLQLKMALKPGGGTTLQSIQAPKKRSVSPLQTPLHILSHMSTSMMASCLLNVNAQSLIL